MLRNLVLTSIGIGAGLGILTIAGGGIGGAGGSVIATAFSVTGAALLAMPSSVARERQQLGSLPGVGIASSTAGFAWIIVGIWIELDGGWVWRVPTTLIVTATAVAVAALLAFAKLEHGQRWVLTAARLGAGVVAAMIIIGIWGESVTGAYWRVFGIIAVLFAAALAATPILHRSTRSDPGVTRFCPFCGADNEAPTGTMTTCPMSHDTYRVIV